MWEPVRTIPPWVQSVEEDDLAPVHSPPLSPANPSSAVVAHHHYSLSEPRSDITSWSPDAGHRPQQSRWTSFAKANAYPREHYAGEKVDPQWLDQNWGDYSKAWLADHGNEDSEDRNSAYHAFRMKRKVWYKRMQFTLLRNPFIPLLFRLIIFFFAAIALALGSSIFHLTRKNRLVQGPSAEMAIIVDAIAMIYILYITYDEYRGKPLGLRSARAKLRIVLLDLFFIVFESANLSLAFQSLSYPGEGCSAVDEGKAGSSTSTGICERQESLASVLLVALIAWLMTFSVSILRLVERVVQK